MCGRFTLKTPLNQLFQQLGLDLDFGSLGDIPPRYNIAPTQSIIAVLGADQTPTPFWMRWGLIPSWSDDISIGNRMINARSETVAEKPAFRKAFAKRRCLIPADGYFEWQAGTTSKAPKQPFWIHLANDKPFFFAGLWESNSKVATEPILSCTILTTNATPEVAHLHDRMPVIIKERDYNSWLNDDGVEQALRVIRDYEREGDIGWQFAPVSTAVNNPRHDDVTNITPLP